MRVRSFFRRRIVRIGGAVLTCAALVSLTLWVLPRPYRPLEYMIAGTAGTIVWLGLVLALRLRTSHRVIRIVRRSERPS